MAEPAEDEIIASLTSAAEVTSTLSAAQAAKSDANGERQPSAASSLPAVPGGFAAVNASSPVTADQGATASLHMPPQNAVAIAHNATQSAQTSDASRAPAPAPSSQVEDVDQSMTSDAITYGTRSRNRTGNARPNYAEDQETDFEAAGTSSKKTAAAESAAVAAQSNAGTKRASDFARLIAYKGSGTSVNGEGPKESTPSTTGATSSSSKKRKAAGPPAQVAASTPPTTSNATMPSVTSARKLAPASSTARETNVMTFTKHKSCLNKKGELVADDGTKLCINGESSCNLLSFCCFSKVAKVPRFKSSVEF